VFVCALRIELFLPQCHSLKEKRSLIRPITDGLRQRFSLSVAEVDHQDKWQRATIGVVAVSGTASMVDDVLDSVERFVWSFPNVEVTEMRRAWLDDFS
jgi:uncharacterized protein